MYEFYLRMNDNYEAFKLKHEKLEKSKEDLTKILESSE
jgi:hypothetical protein